MRRSSAPSQKGKPLPPCFLKSDEDKKPKKGLTYKSNASAVRNTYLFYRIGSGFKFSYLSFLGSIRIDTKGKCCRRQGTLSSWPQCSEAMCRHQVPPAQPV